ncbi:MAG: hypothetical protein ACTSXF_01800, partial [Promethearchaeota archaeon]
GFKLDINENVLEKYNAINYFNEKGIKLNDGVFIPNSDRILIIADKKDPLVSVKNAEEAIKKLKLSRGNYFFFNRADHSYHNYGFSIIETISRFMRAHMTIGIKIRLDKTPLNP